MIEPLGGEARPHTLPTPSVPTAASGYLSGRSRRLWYALQSWLWPRAGRFAGVTSDRRSAAKGHLLISGTGRAGTTALVQYFTVLGFDTGYTVEQTRRRIDPISNAGLEHSLSDENLPYVSKSPHYTQSLGGLLDRGEIAVKGLIIPVRDLFEAAESRRAASRKAEEAGIDPRRQAGGLFRAKKNPARQEERLAVQLYKLVHAAARHEVPIYLLPFPDFVVDEAVLYRVLAPLLEQHGVSREEHQQAHSEAMRPNLVTTYEPLDP